MGAGHLNAKRALQQFAPGEFDPGPISLIGWDYDFINDPDNPNKYVFNQALSAGDYVSITLAWDRWVVLDELSAPFDNEYGPGDEFIDNSFYNVDLHLLPAGATNKNQAISSSTSTVDNLEHIFASIPAGSYEIWVELNDQDLFADASYALTWWAGPDLRGNASRGDFNGDGFVNDEDYDVWVENFGSSNAMVDGSGNGTVDAADYVIWRHNNGMMLGSGSGIESVPEPASVMLLMVGGVLAGMRRKGSLYCRANPPLAPP